jgi:uncharacterized protein YndB with AHSA1/START domain
MEQKEKTRITVEAVVHAPMEMVWALWTTPEHITKWNHASDDWHTPRAENDLRVGGRFLYRMEARDGSSGFDFEGAYSVVIIQELIGYTMDDGRTVRIAFTRSANATLVTESFDAEDHNPVEMQRFGWQAILNNFKRYAESQQQTPSR